MADNVYFGHTLNKPNADVDKLIAGIPAGATEATLRAYLEAQRAALDAQRTELEAQREDIDELRAAGAALDFTIREQVSENGTTGTLTLVIDDPQAIVTKVSFYTRSGNASPSGYVQDTTIPYGAQVALAEDQISYIGYKVESVSTVLAENVVPFAIGGQPFASLETVIDPNGAVSARWTGDNATQSVRIVGSTVEVPTDAAVRAAAPQDGRTGQTGPLTTVGPGAIAWTAMYAYSQPGGVGLESVKVVSQLTRPIAGTGPIPPGIQEVTSEPAPGGPPPILGGLTISLTDPQILFRQIRFRSQVGNEFWSGYTTWTTVPMSHTVEMLEGHVSKIEYEIYTDMGSGTQLWYRGVVPFSTGSIPIAPMLEASFDASGNLTVTLIGDSDTKSSKLGASTVSAAAALSLASSATAVSGRVVQYTNVLTNIGSGVKCYIAAYAYPGTGGAGTQSQPTQTVKDREGAGSQTPSGTVTKRQRVSGIMFQPEMETRKYFKASDGTLLSEDMPAGTINFLTAIQLPSGITITAVRANVYLQNASDQLFMKFRQALAGGAVAFIADLTAIGGAGWQTLSGPLSLAHNSDDQYIVFAQMQGPAGSSGTIRVGWAEFEYTMPSYDKTI